MYVDTLLTQEKGVTLLRIRIILITFVLNLHIIMNVNIEQSWKDHLGEEFEKQYFVDLTEFVRSDHHPHSEYQQPRKHRQRQISGGGRHYETYWHCGGA